MVAALALVFGMMQSPAVRHDANFEDERVKADALYKAEKPLEALPLYEDLCRQDPTVAVFAERHGAGLLAKEATIADPQQRLKVHIDAINEIKRAARLGDNSNYVRVVLDADTKTFQGAVVAGIPLTAGYTYRGNEQAQQVFHEAEAAFGKSDWAAAAKLYEQAASLDAAWYSAALYAGDSYFRMKDTAHAGEWFAKAIAIDPDRETAYRYWGDTLFRAGDVQGARAKFVQAVVAEPYSRAPMAELEQWASHAGHQMVKPAIVRPEFVTPEGKLKIDPALEASTEDGRSSWIVYQQYRVDHGARVLNQVVVGGGSDWNAVVVSPKGYEHSIAEEHAALRALIADVRAKLKSGALSEEKLDPSIKNILALEHDNVLGSWVAINAADAGIRQDYPEYRAHHRQHLVDYVNGFLIR